MADSRSTPGDGRSALAEQRQFAPDVEYRQNHFRSTYTKESRERLSGQNPGQYASLLGDTGWQKAKVYRGLSAAVKAGLVPVSWNTVSTRDDRLQKPARSSSRDTSSKAADEDGHRGLPHQRSAFPTQGEVESRSPSHEGFIPEDVQASLEGIRAARQTDAVALGTSRRTRCGS